MNMDTDNAVSLSEASRDFSKVTRMAKESGEVIILEGNKPQYKLIDMDSDTTIDMTDDEKIDFVAARVLRQYRRAFEELAK